MDPQGGPKDRYRGFDFRAVRHNERSCGQLSESAPTTEGTGKTLSTHCVPKHPSPQPSQVTLPESFRYLSKGHSPLRGFPREETEQCWRSFPRKSKVFKLASKPKICLILCRQLLSIPRSFALRASHPEGFPVRSTRLRRSSLRKCTDFDRGGEVHGFCNPLRFLSQNQECLIVADESR